MKVMYGIVPLFLLVSSAAFGAPRAVDAGEFDIAGVKLGMTVKVAIEAITNKLDVSKAEVKFDKYPMKNLVTQTKEPKYFSVKKGGAEITVYMEPKVPHDINDPMIVSSVVYKQQWTPENAKAMKDMALKKYGEPSNGVIGVSYQWCSKPHSNPGFGCSEFKGPKLKLSGVKLELGNSQYHQAVIDFMNKKKNSKPTF
jgi:hypothetical protein